MKTRLGRTTILVEDYDKAFDFYEKNFFCKKIFDQTTPEGKRYLHISFSKDKDVGIWFLKTESAEENGTIGKQTAGHPTLVIYTKEIEALYQHVKQNRVRILEPLTATPAAKFFHCLDLYGNRLTVIELL
jgi:predicted enzyme related to lactoylglutathione lyase